MKKVALVLATLATSLGMVVGMADAQPNSKEMLDHARRATASELSNWANDDSKTYNRLYRKQGRPAFWRAYSISVGRCGQERMTGHYYCYGQYLVGNAGTNEFHNEKREVIMVDRGGGVLDVVDVKEVLDIGGGNFGPHLGPIGGGGFDAYGLPRVVMAGTH
jgi:hypothetical protein